MKFKFEDKFDYIQGDVLDLKILCKKAGNSTEIPYYWYDIVLKETEQSIGKISIRIGHNYHSYYNGNIGYEVDKEFRGHGYSYIATKMVTDVARHHGMKKLILTCDRDNIASYKTIEKLGAVLKEIVLPPEDYFGFYAGMPEQRIYELDI